MAAAVCLDHEGWQTNLSLWSGPFSPGGKMVKASLAKNGRKGLGGESASWAGGGLYYGERGIGYV